MDQYRRQQRNQGAIFSLYSASNQRAICRSGILGASTARRASFKSKEISMIIPAPRLPCPPIRPAKPFLQNSKSTSQKGSENWVYQPLWTPKCTPNLYPRNQQADHEQRTYRRSGIRGQIRVQEETGCLIGAHVSAYPNYAGISPQSSA